MRGKPIPKHIIVIDLGDFLNYLFSNGVIDEDITRTIFLFGAYAGCEPFENKRVIITYKVGESGFNAFDSAICDEYGVGNGEDINFLI